jgi:hypothetical protein
MSITYNDVSTRLTSNAILAHRGTVIKDFELETMLDARSKILSDWPGDSDASTLSLIY